MMILMSQLWAAALVARHWILPNDPFPCADGVGSPGDAGPANRA